MSSTPGWYGKLPSLGDFASSGLPHEFIKPWDHWLQSVVGASRAAFPERWANIYMSSPMWRFALLPGVLDHRIWTGILAPSVDKVGRQFPLTIALPLDATSAALASIFNAQPWFSTLEEVALSTRDARADQRDLEGDLALLVFPLRTEDDRYSELADWWLGEATVCSIDLESQDAIAMAMSRCAYSTLAAKSTGKTLWWSSRAQGAKTHVLGFDGLPSESHFTRLLQGAESES